MSNSQHWKKTIPPRQFNFPQLQRSWFRGQRRRRSCTCLISGRLFHSFTRPQSCCAEHDSQGSALTDGTKQSGEQHSGWQQGSLWNEVSALHSSISSALPWQHSLLQYHSQRQSQRGQLQPTQTWGEAEVATKSVRKPDSKCGRETT